MKALTLTQPWATLVVLGIKRWETRSWRPVTLPAGTRIAIHAAKSCARDDREFAVELGLRGILPWETTDLPRGAVLGEVTVTGIALTGIALRRGDISELEEELGDYTPGRYAWELSDPQPYPEPIPARGALGLWDWEPPAELIGGPRP